MFPPQISPVDPGPPNTLRPMMAMALLGVINWLLVVVSTSSKILLFMFFFFKTQQKWCRCQPGSTLGRSWWHIIKLWPHAEPNNAQLGTPSMVNKATCWQSPSKRNIYYSSNDMKLYLTIITYMRRRFVSSRWIHIGQRFQAEFEIH